MVIQLVSVFPDLFGWSGLSVFSAQHLGPVLFPPLPFLLVLFNVFYEFRCASDVRHCTQVPLEPWNLKVELNPNTRVGADVDLLIPPLEVVLNSQGKCLFQSLISLTCYVYRLSGESLDA